jgi:predicted amidohydrolase YtcJ
MVEQPDLLLCNGRIYTMDDDVPFATAVMISGDRIVAVGGDDLGFALPAGGRTLDLQGRTVTPGFIDAHIHFVWYSLGLAMVDLRGVPSLEEALARVAERAAAAEPGTWIRGGRWNCNLWGDGSFPHRCDLDRVVPDHPVLLSSKDGHSAWVNTSAMEQAHVTAETTDPPGGRILRDASGEPTGILQENAINLVSKIVPRPSLEEAIAACRQGMAHAHRAGLTGIHDCEDDLALAAFQELQRQGELTMRVLMHIPADDLDAAIDLGVRDGFGNAWLRICGVKAFADGALGSRSAWMLDPYQGNAANTGVPTATAEEMHALVHKANGAGLSVAVHAIGDAANRMVLDAISSTREGALPHLRNRIEHVQLLHPDDVPRLAQLGVIGSMQPIHATSDMEIADRHWGRRAATGYAWRSLLDAGTVLAFGSDAPVEDLAPLLGIHAAVTRRRPDGLPGPDGWYPEQRISVAEAVYAYTMGSACAGGEEGIKGSLVPGKLADLAILDRDIFAIEPMDILHAQVLGTMVGGTFVYRDEGLQVAG